LPGIRSFCFNITLVGRGCPHPWFDQPTILPALGYFIAESGDSVSAAAEKLVRKKGLGNLMLWWWRFCYFLAAPRRIRLFECPILQFNK
jgi:hypothetical protein